VLSDALSSPTFDLDLLYENSVALVALEEVIGVREPRLACTKGYQAALRNTVLQFIQDGQREVILRFFNVSCIRKPFSSFISVILTQF
jgi:hypothetical protein